MFVSWWLAEKARKSEKTSPVPHSLLLNPHGLPKDRTRASNLSSMGLAYLGCGTVCVDLGMNKRRLERKRLSCVSRDCLNISLKN
jgi:hypothetical protein